MPKYILETVRTTLLSVLEITNEVFAPEDTNGEIAAVDSKLLPVVFCGRRQIVQRDDIGVHVAEIEENVG